MKRKTTSGTRRVNRSEKVKGLPNYKVLFADIITLIMFCIPWITYLKIWKMEASAAKIFENYSGYSIDFFLYYRQIAVIIFAFICVCIMLGENIFPDYILTHTPIRAKRNKRIIIFLFLYDVCIIFSTLLSEHKQTALWGSPSEGEGCMALIGYTVLCLAAMNYFCYDKTLKILKKMVNILALLTIVLSLVEFLYKPLLKILFISKAVSEKEYWEIMKNIDVEGFENFVTLTFYNPNYFGGFCILIIPFVLMGFYREKTKVKKVFYLILSIGMLFCVVVAKSTTSFYLALAEVGIITGVEIYRKRNMDVLIRLVIIILVSIVGFIVINYLSDGKLNYVSKNAASNGSGQLSKGECFELSDIKIKDNTLTIYGKKDSISFLSQDSKIIMYDTYGNILTCETDEDNNIYINDERYKMITLRNMDNHKNKILYIDIGYKSAMSFYVEDNKFYGIGQNGAKIESIAPERRYGEKIYPLFTGRGYIWMQTWPLIRQTILLGKGPGNFGLYFTQNDYVGLMNVNGSHRLVVDKPHNMYIQTFVNIGGIALIIQIIVFAIMITGYIKCRKNAELCRSITDMLDITFISVITFAIYGIFNDSIVTVNPVFWIVFGVQLSVQTAVMERNWIEEWK